MLVRIPDETVFRRGAMLVHPNPFSVDVRVMILSAFFMTRKPAFHQSSDQ